MVLFSVSRLTGQRVPARTHTDAHGHHTAPDPAPLEAWLEDDRFFW